MNGSDPPIPVDYKRGRQRFEAAIQITSGVIAQQNTIVNLFHGDVGINYFPSVVVHRNSQDLETPVFVLALKIHEPGDFDLTGATPGSPEIEQHNLALIVGEVNQLATGVLQGEIGRVFALILIPDDWPDRLGRRACDQSQNGGHARDGA